MQALWAQDPENGWGMGDPGPSQHQHLTRPRQSGIQNGLTHVNLARAEDALVMGCHQQQLNSDGSSGTDKWEGVPLNTSEPWMQETTCVFNLCQVPLIHEKQRGGQAGRRKSSGLVLHLLWGFVWGGLGVDDEGQRALLGHGISLISSRSPLCFERAAWPPGKLFYFWSLG